MRVPLPMAEEEYEPLPYADPPATEPRPEPTPLLNAALEETEFQAMAPTVALLVEPLTCICCTPTGDCCLAYRCPTHMGGHTP